MEAVCDEVGCDEEVLKRRAMLAQIYDSFPSHVSGDFWQKIEGSNVPLEILVKLLRGTIQRGDVRGRNRIVECIVGRLQATNEIWACNVLKDIDLFVEERRALVSDLCADLCERMMRAILDLQRPFWEENFLHCLCFERRHVYQSFMKREGRWRSLAAKSSTRVPRILVSSLEQRLQRVHDVGMLDIEDEHAQMMLLAVECSDLMHCVQHLPSRLKAVVLLIFWEGQSEKDAARLLGITDRTVRNRLHVALKLLREALTIEGNKGSELF